MGLEVGVIGKEAWLRQTFCSPTLFPRASQQKLYLHMACSCSFQLTQHLGGCLQFPKLIISPMWLKWGVHLRLLIPKPFLWFLEASFVPIRH